MSILAGCMQALGLFILLVVVGVLILDAREHSLKRRAILRELQRKEGESVP